MKLDHESRNVEDDILNSYAKMRSKKITITIDRKYNKSENIFHVLSKDI